MPRGTAAVAALVALACAAPALAAEFTPAGEAQNYSKTGERFEHESGTPEYQALLRERGVEGRQEEAQILATDPERDFSGSICHSHEDGCAGDVRLWPKHWVEEGHGISEAVLFTARNGATLSGHVWATRAGPALRPGIVITNGSVQAPEELYLFAATTLAKAGYVVLTYDPQGQGRSDTYGEGVDRNDGVPSQNGQPFYDGTEDALDFFLSSPARPYKPRKSCSTGTSHQEKQDRRVAADLNTRANPLSQLVDPSRIGVAGHSLGAAGVSYVGQLDPRVKAIVAWDNLGDSSARPTPPFTCPSGSSPRPAPVPLTKPALGMSNDYGLTPMPYTAAPDEQAKNGASRAYTKAGVDTGQINTRGGTHFEYSFIPNPGFGATLRGMDMAAWYTGAWFDRYVKGDADAQKRLETSRWRADTASGAVDPTGDANMYSAYLKSRLAFGGFVCEDVRAGCSGMSADDGLPPNYSYLALAQTKDTATGTPGSGNPGGVTGGGFKQQVRLKVPRLASDVSTSTSFDVIVQPYGDDQTDDATDHYEVQMARLRRGAAPEYRALPIKTDWITGMRVQGRAGSIYAFRARAVSRGGRAGPWDEATTIVPKDLGRRRVRLRGRWSSVKDMNAFGGTWQRSPGAPATMTLRARGTRLYLIGTVGPGRGRATLVVNGRRRTRNLGSRYYLPRYPIADLKLKRGRTYAVSVIVRRGPVELDAFAVVP